MPAPRGAVSPHRTTARRRAGRAAEYPRRRCRSTSLFLDVAERVDVSATAAPPEQEHQRETEAAEAGRGDDRHGGQSPPEWRALVVRGPNVESHNRDQRRDEEQAESND